MGRPDSFHFAGDGRGCRLVFVNGNEIDNVEWCDTKSGVVVFAPSPVRTMKAPRRDEIYTRRLRGTVTVVPK